MERVSDAELRGRARQEADELGPEPADPRDHALWREEREAAELRLAELAAWDGGILQRAAFDVADPADPARRLLFDAANVTYPRSYRRYDGHSFALTVMSVVAIVVVFLGLPAVAVLSFFVVPGGLFDPIPEWLDALAIALSVVLVMLIPLSGFLAYPGSTELSDLVRLWSRDLNPTRALAL